MTTATVKLHSLAPSNARTWIFALIFIAGNIILPQICHLAQFGGPIMLPIYFFTLIGAYKFGINVGLLTAVLSPMVNNLLFGMPATEMLPIILFKSIALASVAAYAAHYFKKVSLPVLLLVVLSYQIIGSAFEWAWVGNRAIALQDFRLGLPGMLLQVVGGYLTLKAIARL